MIIKNKKKFKKNIIRLSIILIIASILIMVMLPQNNDNLKQSPDTTFTVSVSERGLPSGMQWTGFILDIATGGNNTISTTSSTVSFSLGNGTYEYCFNSLNGYYPLNPNGYFTVSNGTYSLVAEYQANTTSAVYTVTFDPQNIGSSTWTLVINSKSYTQSGDLSINLNGGSYFYTASSDNGSKVVNSTQLDLTSNTTVDLTFYTIPHSGLSGTLNSFFTTYLKFSISDLYMVIGILSGIVLGYLLVRKTGSIVLFALPNLVISLMGDILSLMPLWMFIVELFAMFASIIIPAKLNGDIDDW